MGPSKRQVTPHDNMLPECIAQFGFTIERLNEIRDGMAAMSRELVAFRLELPGTIAQTLRNHEADCPALQRLLSHAIHPPVVDDEIKSEARRVPRWLLYLIGGGLLSGGGGLAAWLKEMGII